MSKNETSEETTFGEILFTCLCFSPLAIGASLPLVAVADHFAAPKRIIEVEKNAVSFIEELDGEAKVVSCSPDGDCTISYNSKLVDIGCSWDAGGDCQLDD